MKVLLLIFFLLTLNCSFGQFEKVPSDVAYKTKTEELLKLKDSSVQVFKYFEIEMDEFDVCFSNVLFDKSSNELKLTGMVFLKGTVPPTGVPSVEIYLANRNTENKLLKFQFLGQAGSLENPDSIGVFSITVRLKKNESIMFYMPRFYLLEFRLGEQFGLASKSH